MNLGGHDYTHASAGRSRRRCYHGPTRIEPNFPVQDTIIAFGIVRWLPLRTIFPVTMGRTHVSKGCLHAP